MKKLILIINSHARVGRTSCAKVLETYLDRKGAERVSVHTCDGEGAGDSLLWDVDAGIEIGSLLELVESADVTIADVAARHAEEVGSYFAESSAFDLLADIDAEVTVFIPVCAETDMSDEVVQIGEQFSDEASYAIVRSATGSGTSEEDRWSGCYGEKVMSYLGAAEIEMPAFNEELLSQIEEEQGMSVPEALVARKGLPRFLRDEVHRWELAFSDNLSCASEILVPAETHTKSAYSSA